jgi:hypothetical protein
VPGKYSLQELFNFLYTNLVVPKERRYHGHCNFFTHSSLKRHLHNAGFEIVAQKTWGGPLRGTSSAAVGMALNIALKAVVHRRSQDEADTKRVVAVQESLRPVYNVLSSVDRKIEQQTYAFVEVVGFVCRKRPTGK